MTRTTRNSQRAATEATIPTPPSSRTPPPSEKGPAEYAVPFPAMVDGTSSQVEEKTPSPRRRSNRQASRPVVEPSAAPTTTRSLPVPSTPFRRPPTGSRAQRTTLGDLIPQPPLPVASADEREEVEEVEEEEEEEEGWEKEKDRSPSPGDTEIGSPHRNLRRKYTEEPELQDLQDIYWKSEYPVIHQAWGPRPKHHEQVQYYQENEWGTDEEEYPEPDSPPQQWSIWTPERSPYELFEGESEMRNMKITEKFERVVGRHKGIRRYKFAAPNEGPKIRLVEDTVEGQVWVGVTTSPKPPPAQSTSPDFCADKNDELVNDTKADAHPNTGPPAAEYLASQVNELLSQAKLAEEEFQAMQKSKAGIYGELMMENEELEDEKVELDALWKRLRTIVDPDFFEVLARCPHGKKRKIREPFLEGDPQDISTVADGSDEMEGTEEMGEREETDEHEDMGEDEDTEDDEECEEDEEWGGNEEWEEYEDREYVSDGNDIIDGEDDDDNNDADGANPGPSTASADTTSNKLDARPRPKALTRERNIDAAALAELIAGLTPTIITPTTTTPTTVIADEEDSDNQGEGEGEDRGDACEKEKSPILDTTFDAEAFARGMLEQPNWQSTPPRAAAPTSNENENVIPRKAKATSREGTTANALAEKLVLPVADTPPTTLSDNENNENIDYMNLQDAQRAAAIAPQAIADGLAPAGSLPLPTNLHILPLPPNTTSEEVVTTTAGAKENAPHTPLNTPYVPMRLSPTTPSRSHGQPSTAAAYSFAAAAQCAARAFGASNVMGPRRRARSSARLALQTIQSPQKDSDEEDETDQEDAEKKAEKKAGPAFDVYTGPSLPTDNAELARVTLQVKRECVEVVLKDLAPIDHESYNWDEFYEDDLPREEGQVQSQAEGKDQEEKVDEAVTEVVLPVVPEFKIWVQRENEEYDAAQQASDSEDEGEKSPPRRVLFIRESMLKRGRDESDEEKSANGSDEDEDSGIASKKRRFSGSYGASDEHTPVASAPQAERFRQDVNETDQTSWNRPLPTNLKNSSSNDCEDEDQVESILSATSPTDSTSSSRAGSPRPTVDFSLIPRSRIPASSLQMGRSSAPSPSPDVQPIVPLPTPLFNQGTFSGAQFSTMRGGHGSAEDVEMSDASDEEIGHGNTAPRPIPAALGPAPPVSPSSIAPAIFGRRPLTRGVRAMMRYSKPVNFKDLRK